MKKCMISVVVSVMMISGLAKADLLSENLGASAYSASGTYLTYVPTNAFDGSTASVWTSGNAMQWIEVDLGEMCDISEFVLTPFYEIDLVHSEVYVYVSDSPIQGDLAGATEVAHRENVDRYNEVITFLTPVTGRYVQVRKTQCYYEYEGQEEKWVGYREVQVFGVPHVPNGDLLSENLGASAYSASSAYLTSVPTNAFDGSTASVWTSGNAMQWIEVDLGEMCDISEFVLTPFYEIDLVHSEVYVYVSDSPIQGDLAGATEVAHRENVDRYNEVITFLTPVTGRYVQVRKTQCYYEYEGQEEKWVGYREVQVFGVPQPPQGTTIIIK